MTQGWAPPVPLTFTASEDLVRYRFAKLGTGDNIVDQCDSQGESAFGVVVEDVDQSEADGASIWPLNRGGIVPVEASAAVTAGVDVTTSANGRVELAASSDIVLGTAVEAASGAGHVIGIAINDAQRVVA